MKRKSCLVLAVLLVMAQMISLFAVMPASAEHLGRSQDVPEISFAAYNDSAAVIDPEWASVPSFADFTKSVSGTTARPEGHVFDADMKMAWAPAANAGYMTLYFLIQVTDNTPLPAGTAHNGNGNWDGLKLSYVIDGVKWSRPNLLRGLGGSEAGYAWSGWKMKNTSTGVEDTVLNLNLQKTDVGYNIKLKIDVKETAEMKFDFIIQDNYTGAKVNTDYDRWSWNGIEDTQDTNTPTGTLKFLGKENIVPPEEKTYTIDIPKATGPITIDALANESAWEGAAVSDNFQNVGTEVTIDGFSGSFKALWAPVEGDETKMNVYLLVTAVGHVKWRNNNYRNSLRVQIETADSSQWFWTGMKQLGEETISGKPNFNGGTSGGAPGAFQLDAINHIAADGTVTYEFCYQMNKADSIRLDVWVGACSNDWKLAEASWAGMTNASMSKVSVLGVGNIVDGEVGGEEDNDAIVSTPGASIRVDTDTPKMSGIRFASSVDMDYYNSLIGKGATVTTGTIIVPTKSLTTKGIADADFTKEALVEAGLTEDVHFYDIKNEGWVEGQEGTWYATLYDIQDFTRSFSAVGYVTYVLNGETVTVYSEYQASNARSIAQVAQRVMAIETAKGLDNSNEGDWNLLQEEILLGFFIVEE